MNATDTQGNYKKRTSQLIGYMGSFAHAGGRIMDVLTYMAEGMDEMTKKLKEAEEKILKLEEEIQNLKK